ncbi:MAG: 3-phosphoshikimate 1-carboxyvinyltransferase [Propionicimonas sp.]|nr:3-phosphoshikimate 1-carboxyvinyltransferase [Propionicimonas sp.]
MTAWEAPLAAAPVSGRLTVPGSKSTTARAYLLAGLADSPSLLHGALEARDTRLMRTGLTRLGVAFEDTEDGAVRVTPPPQFHGGGTIDVGLAGTAMRFLPPIAALVAPATRFVGDPEAAARPVAPLLQALADLGADVSGPHRLPFSVGGPIRGGRVTLDSSASSQFVSGLLLAGVRYRDGVVVEHTGGPLPSLPHIQMTVSMLTRRGARVEQPAPLVWQVYPGAITGVVEHIEPDLTTAASLLAAAVITGGELTTVWPQDSLQAGDALAAALAAFGTDLRYQDTADGRTLTVTGPERLSGVDLDLHEVSELTPVVAALAAAASTRSVIRGVGHIRGHETDRLAALEIELAALGANVRQSTDGLEFSPGALHGGVFHTWGDHRLAHAGALLGLITPGVVLDDVSCTTKTLPDFVALWSELAGSAA